MPRIHPKLRSVTTVPPQRQFSVFLPSRGCAVLDRGEREVVPVAGQSLIGPERYLGHVARGGYESHGPCALVQFRRGRRARPSHLLSPVGLVSSPRDDGQARCSCCWRYFCTPVDAVIAAVDSCSLHGCTGCTGGTLMRELYPILLVQSHADLQTVVLVSGEMSRKGTILSRCEGARIIS